EDAERSSFKDIDTIDATSGNLLGTPGFMAPEQIRCDPIDGRADVYSLGCILYEILAGQPLHPRGAPALAHTLAGVDAKPSTHAPDLAPELDAICARATATAPADRYPTARALGNAVQRFLDGDRDLALRTELAATQLAAARTALDAGDRRVAMQA